MLQDNIRLGGLRGQSFTGSSTIFNPSAEIWFQTEGASSPTSSAAEIIFATTPAGALSTVERMTIKFDGNVGIGRSTPDTKLHVAGSVKIVDGTQGANKVLTSDTNGVASWQVSNNEKAYGEICRTNNLTPIIKGTENNISGMTVDTSIQFNTTATSSYLRTEVAFLRGLIRQQFIQLMPLIVITHFS